MNSHKAYTIQSHYRRYAQETPSNRLSLAYSYNTVIPKYLPSYPAKTVDRENRNVLQENHSKNRTCSHNHSFLKCIFIWWSEVATERAALGKIIPKAKHLSWRLVMCSKIAFHTPVLTKFPAVRVLDSLNRTVELLDPHTHAHILHLEQPQILISILLANGPSNISGYYICRAISVRRIYFFPPLLIGDCPLAMSERSMSEV